MRKFKLKKYYKGITCDCWFILSSGKLTAVLPFSGEVSFPESIMNEEDFKEYFQEDNVDPNFIKESTDFYSKLKHIIDQLGSVEGHYDDAGCDWRVSDKIDLFLRDEKINDYVKEELKYAQRKIKEAYLTIKEMKEKIAMYD